MCGIFGYTGPRPATPLLLEGLAGLEYRGYDSAGICVASAGGGAGLQVVRAAGKLPALRERVEAERPQGLTGMGHTRWATHGPPTEANAQPLVSGEGRSQVVTVQNGIVENHAELREELSGLGFSFASDTDAECIPHLIRHHMSEGMDLAGAVRAAAVRLRGANAVVAMAAGEPDRLVAMRIGHAGGLVIGAGSGEALVASDLAAISPHARSVYYLGTGEVAEITAGAVTLTDLGGAPVKRPPSRAPQDPARPLAAARGLAARPSLNGSAALRPQGSGGHFMLREINEQPEALASTLEGRVPPPGDAVRLGELSIPDEYLRSVGRVVLIGMGTSLHAAMVGRMWIENLAMVPAEVDNSSEFRYRRPVIDGRTLVISISQSGETADTLAAMEEARARGAMQITLSNAEGSHATRIADAALPIRAGAELGVAATKTFTCSLAALYLLALHIGRARGVAAGAADAAADLARLPGLVRGALGRQDRCEEIAVRYKDAGNFLYLGRGLSFPLAMEGALKLKEISYIHAEGYPAGEMKHGPISLIEEGVPVVALMPAGELFDKMLSNVHEVRARGGRVLAVTTEDAAGLEGAASDVLTVPAAPAALCPILMSVPMQLLAYHVGVLRGCDVDRPRNLAKSVTVE